VPDKLLAIADEVIANEVAGHGAHNPIFVGALAKPVQREAAPIGEEHDVNYNSTQRAPTPNKMLDGAIS
jgi:hypothetical protein